jgi:hypothetical protein
MPGSKIPAAQGPIHLFPMMVEADMTLNGVMAFGPTPWGVPSGMGATGTRNADNVELLALLFESPQEVFYAPTPISKEASERVQLERLRTDYRMRGTRLPFESVERGPDPSKPPDFLVSNQGRDGSFGLDVTRLSITERMTAQALFRRLRQAILACPREEFAHLTGSVVYLWFDQDGFSSLPPKEEDAVQALPSALRDYEFNPELTLQDVAEGPPEHLGDFGKQSSGKGAHFYAIPMSNGTPSSFFFLSTGFELGLGFQTSHDTPSAWSSITRLINSHDNPQTQMLVISVAAPDRNGLSYPSEIALMDFALSRPAPPIAPRHIEEVYLHSWMDGALTRVHPVVDCIAGPLYQGGFLPSHFSLAPLPVYVSDEIAQGNQIDS